MNIAIALDLGSTSIKAGLLQHDGKLHEVVAHAVPEVAVNGGRYESDALAYAQAAEQVLAQCLAQAGKLPPLGLCSQRSSFLIWEKASGQPLTPLISWQDRRGAASCTVLRDWEGSIRKLSGLPLTPYYFAPKLRVVLQENPQWRERLERGEYLVGTLDTFLIWRWTDGRHFVTDASMAARTLLMDVQRQQWSPELCDLFGIPSAILPRIIPSVGANIKLDNGLTLQSSMGDQSAAFFACVGNDDSAALVNLGTGGFVMRILDNEPDGYLRTLLYQEGAAAHIAAEGTLNSIAAALASYPVADCRYADMAGSDIFCLAEPSGLGAPYFRNDLGMCFSQPVAHLSAQQVAVLLLEGIVFRVARILEDFHRVSPVGCIYLSGGLSALACLQYGIAQCAPAPVYLLPQADASLQGAALLAAGQSDVGVGQGVAIKAEPASRLPEKYALWKNWLDGLLLKHAAK